MSPAVRRMLKEFGWDDPFDWDDPSGSQPMTPNDLKSQILAQNPQLLGDDLEAQLVQILRDDTKWDYRSLYSLRTQCGVAEETAEAALYSLKERGLVAQHYNNQWLWGLVERVGKPVDMSREERSLEEQALWDKAHPINIPVPGFAGEAIRTNPSEGVLDPATFTMIPAGEPPGRTDLCESESEGIMMPQHRRRHRHHMRSLRMVIDRLPSNLIVKALADAIAHTREVSEREHIKADRIERVNQFIVSLRRNLSYMGDNYRTEREYLSAQMARKEVWYDVGVLNPPSISGLTGTSSLKTRDVENWLAQAEVIAPSYGDLKAEIERDLQRLKGSILVAESCNATAGQLNREADGVLSKMAELAEDM